MHSKQVCTLTLAVPRLNARRIELLYTLQNSTVYLPDPIPVNTLHVAYGKHHVYVYSMPHGATQRTCEGLNQRLDICLQRIRLSVSISLSYVTRHSVK